MFKINDEVKIRRYGSLCAQYCGEPCPGERGIIKDIDNSVITIFFMCDGEECGRFVESDLELIEKIKKIIKPFGIVKFLDSLNKREGTNV